MAAIASVLPVVSMQAAQDAGKRPARWKTNLKIGFYPDHLRHPVDHGGAAGVLPAAGPECRSDQSGLGADPRQDHQNMTRPTFVAHALAISMGLGSNATPMNVATIQNINGQGHHDGPEAQGQP
jgi:nitrate/nitrite transport system substrate-binding protein